MSQTRNEATGWLVSSVGRDFMLGQVESAESSGNPEIAAQLRAWTEDLTPESEAESALRSYRIHRATSALEAAAGIGVWEEGEAEKWATVALRGAGVIR